MKYDLQTINFFYYHFILTNMKTTMKNSKHLTAFHFEVFGSQMFTQISDSQYDDYFPACFGTSPRVCKEVYNFVVDTGVVINPKNLLMNLFFLKVYPTSRAISVLSDLDRNATKSSKFKSFFARKLSKIVGWQPDVEL